MGGMKPRSFMVAADAKKSRESGFSSACYTSSMKYRDFLRADRPCPFCEGGQRAIAENETAMLTYSLAPYHPDHMLVVPKRHVERILEISDAEMRDIDALLKAGLGKLKRLGYDSVTFLVREGRDSGKSINHLHHHIIPQIALGNADHAGADREVLDEEGIERLIARLKAA
jgi:diadenosine tetraphosphate (Ap4A) HIT family hydrolase